MHCRQRARISALPEAYISTRARRWMAAHGGKRGIRASDDPTHRVVGATIVSPSACLEPASFRCSTVISGIRMSRGSVVLRMLQAAWMRTSFSHTVKQRRAVFMMLYAIVLLCAGATRRRLVCALMAVWRWAPRGR